MKLTDRELADRCEQAAGPNYSLDCQIAETALRIWHPGKPNDRYTDWTPAMNKECAHGFPDPSLCSECEDFAPEVGRPVPIHASGPSESVKDCIMCGLPYRWHDQNPANWLACPPREKLVEIEAELEDQLARLTAALKQEDQP